MVSQNRVLIAEDDKGVRDAIRRALEQEGYEVTVAEDGSRALEISQHMAPDLYLLDVMMPNIDGLSVCKTLRQRGDVTPILVVTAADLNEKDLERLRGGVENIIQKSQMTRDQIVQEVSALITSNSGTG